MFANFIFCTFQGLESAVCAISSYFLLSGLEEHSATLDFKFEKDCSKTQATGAVFPRSEVGPPEKLKGRLLTFLALIFLSLELGASYFRDA